MSALEDSRATALPQGCILFPRFLYPSLFSLQVKSCVFCNLGGVNNYGTFLLQICFIMFQKFPKIPHKNPMFFQICHIFLISFPVLSKVVLVLADIYRPKRNYIHPCSTTTTTILCLLCDGRSGWLSPYRFGKIICFFFQRITSCPWLVGSPVSLAYIGPRLP